MQQKFIPHPSQEPHFDLCPCRLCVYMMLSSLPLLIVRNHGDHLDNKKMVIKIMFEYTHKLSRDNQHDPEQPMQMKSI